MLFNICYQALKFSGHHLLLVQHFCQQTWPQPATLKSTWVIYCLKKFTFKKVSLLIYRIHFFTNTSKVFFHLACNLLKCKKSSLPPNSNFASDWKKGRKEEEEWHRILAVDARQRVREAREPCWADTSVPAVEIWSEVQQQLITNTKVTFILKILASDSLNIGSSSCPLLSKLW